MNWRSVLVLLFLLCSKSICKEEKKDDSEEVFVATNEWKVIKEGQKVPSGLHYRINLSTGKKEAKINQPSDASDSSKSFSLLNNDEGTDEIEEILKEVNKNPQPDTPKKFRTMEEIKKELGDIQMKSKSDIEILRELFDKFDQEESKKNSEDMVVLNILRDLAHLGHQIDNGVEFYKMGGFTKIIYKKLNSTNVSIKQEALKLFSTLAQNSPRVKVHVLETGGITILLRLLNLEENHHIQSSTLTALSCTLRSFPYAQNEFVHYGGLTIFTELFKNAPLKLKLKIATLLTDFVIERQKDKINFENHQFIDIEEALYNSSWCNNLNDLLHDLTSVDWHDHDSIEKCLLAMKAVMNKCGNSYDRNVIVKLSGHYKMLAERNEEDTEDYFRDLLNLTEALINSNGSSEHINRDEL